MDFSIWLEVLKIILFRNLKCFDLSIQTPNFLLQPVENGSGMRIPVKKEVSFFTQAEH